MRLTTLLIFTLALFFSACDSNESGLAPCTAELNLSGDLQGNAEIGFSNYYVIAGNGTSSQLRIGLGSLAGDGIVLASTGDACGITRGELRITFPTGTQDSILREGNFSLGNSETYSSGLTFTFDCLGPDNIVFEESGSFRFDEVSEDRLVGSLQAQLTTGSNPDTLNADLSARFNAGVVSEDFSVNTCRPE
jgi:hypothetical protein